MKSLGLLLLVLGTVSCSEESTTPPADASHDGVVVDTGADSDGTVDADACGSRTEAKIAQFNDPSSAKKANPGDALRLRGVIVTTPLVLLQRDSILGKCTYGVFVADANATFLPYSGLVLVDIVPATVNDGGAVNLCTLKEPTVLSSLAVGDLYDVAGTYDVVLPPNCIGDGAPSPPATPRLSNLCGVTKVGQATPIAPADVNSFDLLDSSSNLPKWMNGVVRVKNVSAKTALDTFGNFPLTGSGLVVTDRFYFKTWGRPSVGAFQHFDEIVGESSFYNCAWSLEPRTICELKPVPRDAGATPACP